MIYCENIFCIYEQGYICTNESPHIGENGQCKSYIRIDIDEEEIKAIKKRNIDKLIRYNVKL